MSVLPLASWIGTGNALRAYPVGIPPLCRPRLIQPMTGCHPLCLSPWEQVCQSKQQESPWQESGDRSLGDRSLGNRSRCSSGTRLTGARVSALICKSRQDSLGVTWGHLGSRTPAKLGHLWSWPC